MANMKLSKFSVSPIHRISCSLIIALSLCLLISPSRGALYLVTQSGYVARSADDGETWSWLTTTLPISQCVDMTSDPAHNLYVLNKTGEVYYSVNQGTSWDSWGNISVSDACALWLITGFTFVITESGDFYQRDAGVWSLIGNVGASDCVDLVPKPAGDWLVLTRSSDVWDVTTDPFSASLVGNINSSTIVGATSLTTSVIAITEEGDVARSGDNGVHWSWVGSVSQLSITGLSNKNGYIYLTTHCGEVARSTNEGSDWTWQGTVSQIGITGITSDTLTLIGVEEHTEIEALRILRVYPNPSRGRFTVRFYASGDGSGCLRIFDILGRDRGTLWRGAINEGVNTIHAEEQSTGVYFLLIETDNAKATEKIILE
ncbi:MAG: T9SS type A sorting domain-containing protein [candidate division WOR-3 bacterium]|nr:MAG: T9SS type A sorting domain-containing protein [candidate division WOR-3 bacterium]